MIVTTHLHLVPRTRLEERYLHTTIRVHGTVLDYLRAGINFAYEYRFL
jgi:hypothetical protein